MSDFVNVPVPSHLVIPVMQFIADQDQPREAGVLPATGPSPSDSGPGTREWSKEELEQLYASEAGSIKKFCQVLTLLANVHPQSMSVDELGAHFGIKGLTLQQSFGPATRWMKNHVKDDDRWPIAFTPEGWKLVDANVDMWKAIVG